MIDYDGTSTPPIHNLKYGPLVNVKVSQEATLVKKRIDKEGNVVYDTISNNDILSPKVPTPLNEEEWSTPKPQNLKTPKPQNLNEKV